jgi:alpha-L-fucosidase 2
MDGEGLRFQTLLEATVDGGQSGTSGDRLDITGANSVTLLLSAATSYVNHKDISGDPAGKNEAVMAAARTKSYKALKKAHVDDLSALMSRVHLTVGDPAKNAIPTDERLEAIKAGASDPNLEALIFQFGRYTLASASRTGGQASNLQGIWNEEFLPPWGSKWTTNINVQMNYWMAEVTNLAETTGPLFDLIEEATVPGAKTAKVYYGIDEGWVVHHNLDVWKSTAPVDAARYGMWPVGGAWLTRHIWEHYEYDPDIEFLKKYYPVMKGAAQFLSNLLTLHPPTGWLVTPISMSPEHGFLYGTVDTPGDKHAWVSPAPTMDIAIIRDLFPYVIEAAGILGTDSDFAARLADQLTKLPPYRINRRGTVQEWIYDFDSGPEGHNMSTHYAFYPGNSMLLHRESDRELVAAQAKFLEGRPSGGSSWQTRWDLAMWARLERSDMVAKFITDYAISVANNLYNNNRYNQIDATAGNTGGIAEALIQSHAGEISLLPALPTTWPEGSVTGLRARGGYEVNMTWAGGALRSAEISSARGGTITVRAGGRLQEVTVEPGKVTKLSF